MRFASLGGTSNYAQAGKAVADDAARIFDTARSNSVDFGKLAQTSRDMKSKENAAISAADSKVASQKVISDASVKVKKEEIYRDELRAKSRRKAGVVAALGKAGAGLADVFMDKPKKRDHSSSIALQERLTQQANDLRSGIKPIDTNAFTNTNTSTSSTNASAPNTGGTGASNSSTTAQSGGVGGKGIGGTDMDYMKSFVDKGYTPMHAAAIVGNMRYESGDFKHIEELSPNSYGTRGLGAFQWTNAGGSNRRTDFENWSSQNNLATNSFEANAGFAHHEMSGGTGASHWTGGGGLAGFQGTQDLNSATSHFMNNYLRPASATANLSERQRRAQDTYTRWQAQNS
jgi:hypothetical protein